MIKEYTEAEVRLIIEGAIQEEREEIEQAVLNTAMQYAEPVWAIDILNAIRARGQE